MFLCVLCASVLFLTLYQEVHRSKSFKFSSMVLCVLRASVLFFNMGYTEASILIFLCVLSASVLFFLTNPQKSNFHIFTPEKCSCNRKHDKSHHDKHKNGLHQFLFCEFKIL